MIHTTDNFFNKVIKEVRAVYFAKENHVITEIKTIGKLQKQ